jgi:hypothetical protein
MGSALILLGGLVLIGSAGAKFAHIPPVVTELGGFGFEGNKLTLIAIVEVLSALLFLVPFTRSAGLLLVSSFMGGAIATHIQHGQSPLQPAVVLCLIWLGAWLRHPKTLWSLSGTRVVRQSPQIGQSTPEFHSEKRLEEQKTTREVHR